MESLGDVTEVGLARQPEETVKVKEFTGFMNFLTPVLFTE